MYMLTNFESKQLIPDEKTVLFFFRWGGRGVPYSAGNIAGVLLRVTEQL